MNIDYILMAHGIGGKGGISFPTIGSFVGKSNDVGTEIQFTWKNPSIIEFQKVTMFSSTTNISNLSYKDLIDGDYKKEVDSKINNYTMKGLKHNDHIYVKIFPIYLSVGEEVVGQGSALDVIVKDIVPPSTITNMNIKSKDKELSLSWTNPTDVDFEKVVIRYKIGAINSITDGTLAYEGKNTNVNITGLTNEVEYTIRAFTVDKAGNINNSNMIYKATPIAQWIYAFEVNGTNSNPATAVTYIGQNQSFTPAKVTNGIANYGSWEDFLKKISYRVVVKNGVEQYKVQYDNPTKKLDGSNAILTGADGDLFTKFVHIWRKYTKTTNGYRIELSDKPFTGAKSLVTELENGYNQFNNPIMILLQDLYLLIFKDRDSQRALGRGYVDGNGGFINTGGTNGKGYIYGETTGKLQMCFLGIEDLWGNKFQWVDGLVSDGSYNILTGTKSFNDGGTGYTKFTTGVASSLSGYAKTVQGGDAGYVLADTAGSTSTGYCDYGGLSSGKVAYFGGSRSVGDYAGVFSVHLADSASYSSSTYGARLCFKNTEGVYVGNYLGFVEGTKLRSISGKVPTEKKTIGAFRTHAKNNN